MTSHAANKRGLIRRNHMTGACPRSGRGGPWPTWPRPERGNYRALLFPPRRFSPYSCRFLPGKSSNTSNWAFNNGVNPPNQYDLERMLPQAYENWARSAAPWFGRTYGLDGNFALPVARLYVTLWANGLDPRITSGYRDGSRQAELRDRWDRGDRAGIRVRPAEQSLHTYTGFFGGPASRAIDMPCKNDRLAAELATRLGGIGSGIYFRSPDPGHYYAT